MGSGQGAETWRDGEADRVGELRRLEAHSALKAQDPRERSRPSVPHARNPTGE